LSAGFWLYQQNFNEDPGIAEVQEADKTDFTQLSDNPGTEKSNTTETSPPAEESPEKTFDASEQKYQEAVALIADGQADKAIAILQEIPKSSPNYHSLAQFELAKLFIEQQRLSEATQILTDLINAPGDHYVKEEAQKMLRKLSIPTSIFE
ncbi:MAG: tetratricopeptide repeat protein, partial [Phaeodactylibacter sp.]|nr:tetratricopeptide repeat protein [Phaeodactylibacter sp.]